MWPYNSEEQVWLVPSKEWAETLPKPVTKLVPVPTPANDDNGAWPYAAVESGAEDRRPLDPQVMVRK